MGFIGQETIRRVTDMDTRRALEALVEELERVERLGRPLAFLEEAIVPAAMQSPGGAQVQVGMFVALEGGWAVPAGPSLETLPVGVCVGREIRGQLGDGGPQIVIRYVTAGQAWVLLEDAGAEMLSEIYVGEGGLGSVILPPLTSVRVKAGQVRAKKALEGVSIVMGLVALDWFVIKPR